MQVPFESDEMVLSDMRRMQSVLQSQREGAVADERFSNAVLRERLASLLHAESAESIFFCESEIGSMHWLAYFWGLSSFEDGDEMLLSPQDSQQSNEIFYRLQEQLSRFGISLRLRTFSYKDNGEFDLQELLSLLSARTCLILVPHIHPVFGTKNESDIAYLKQQAGEKARVVVDLSGSVNRIPVDVRRLQCDLAFFSGQNLFSPFPTGILYSKLPIEQSSFLRREIANGLVRKRLLEGVDLLSHVDMQQMALHLQELSQYLLTGLRQIPSLEFLPGLGYCDEQCSPGYGIVSFRLPGIAAEECVQLLAERAILVDRVELPHYPDAITLTMHAHTTQQHIDVLLSALLQLGL